MTVSLRGRWRDAGVRCEPFLTTRTRRSGRASRLRQVPVANLPARFGVNAGGRFLRATFGLTQQIGLVLFQGEGPDQTQAFHFFNEGRLQNTKHPPPKHPGSGGPTARPDLGAAPGRRRPRLRRSSEIGHLKDRKDVLTKTTRRCGDILKSRFSSRVDLVLHLPLHAGIATPDERTADLDAIDRRNH